MTSALPNRLPALAAALLLSLAVNLALFGFLPALVGGPTGEYSTRSSARTVDFIPAPRETRPEPRELPEEKLKKLPERKKMPVPGKEQLLFRTPLLPLDLTPRLPPTAEAPALPPQAFVAIDAPLTKKVYGYKELDQALVPLFQLAPAYPPRALRLNIQGWVKVEFVITQQGRTRDVKVLESEPAGIFEKAALKAVRAWRFQPPVKHGKAVEASYAKNVVFQLVER